MKNVEQDLLAMILTAWFRRRAIDPKQQRGEGHYVWLQRVREIAEMNWLGIKVDRDWIGSSPAQKMARSRALAALERDGWIIRESRYGGGSLTHVRPTEAGLSLAGELSVAIPPPVPPPPPPPPPVEHPKTLVQQRREKAEAWVLECQQSRREAAQ